MKRFWLLFVALFGLWGCSTVDIDDYRAEKPVLELRDYFNGTLDAWGMFQDRSGKVVAIIGTSFLAGLLANFHAIPAVAIAAAIEREAAQAPQEALLARLAALEEQSRLFLQETGAAIEVTSQTLHASGQT